ncbi:putative movement protein 1 [Pelargonium chlorotic ring pattern virus]|nr:putative movement protein 1 [Pelargonium chlorotic ring pattern virus]AAT69552.1 putative movement protein 1 [Pelargonium chlorotic ring pattern virus]
MDPSPPSADITSTQQNQKRGKAKNRLDVAHSGVSKASNSDLVGANFITVAETVNFTVHLNF